MENYFFKFNKKVFLITAGFYGLLFIILSILLPISFVESFTPDFPESISLLFQLFFKLVKFLFPISFGIQGIPLFSLIGLLLLVIQFIFTYFVVMSFFIIYQQIKFKDINLNLNLVPSIIFIGLQIFGFLIIGQILMNSQICLMVNSLSPSNTSNSCIYKIALENNDIELCKYVLPNGNQINCFYKIIEKTKDLSLCEELKFGPAGIDHTAIWMCYSNFAIIFNDKSICNRIDNSSYNDRCQMIYEKEMNRN